jgi:spore maturation protein CgeB
MRFVLFYHSLISDWNHGNAHFLRGVVSELKAQGHRVDVFEPRNGWSLRNLLDEQGSEAVDAFQRAFPALRSALYDIDTLDLDVVLQDADVVLVHEWNEPELVRRVGEWRRRGGRFKLFFHDTHHRAISDPASIRRFDLRHYDGVLAFGEVLRQIYEDRGWAPRAWTWHEAADVRHFKPVESPTGPELDLVWIGNWGDGERALELQKYLVEPVHSLRLRAEVYGVRYPEEGRLALRAVGIEYRGFLPNYRVPTAFARAAATVHVPRRFYSQTLPGIPTIRVFEALACGIPLVCAPWDDCEQLFESGRDFLMAANGSQMREHLRMLKASPDVRQRLASFGLQTIHKRHTCAHRVAELLTICESLDVATPSRTPAKALAGAHA